MRQLIIWVTLQLASAQGLSDARPRLLAFQQCLLSILLPFVGWRALPFANSRTLLQQLYFGMGCQRPSQRPHCSLPSASLLLHLAFSWWTHILKLELSIACCELALCYIFVLAILHAIQSYIRNSLHHHHPFCLNYNRIRLGPWRKE